MKKIKALKAFTLAEVIIVIGIIGIVAEILIPPFMQNFTQRAFNQAKELTFRKIQEATNQMRTQEVLTGYDTTEKFVDAFSKYIKIVKRCPSTALRECFPEKFKTGEGEEIESQTLTKGKSLGKADYPDTVGLGLINGTMLIMSYDPNCKYIPPYDNKIDTTGCISMVYDINGYGKPNQVGRDIATLNATITTCDGVKVGSLCVSGGDITSYLPDGTYTDPWGSNPDYWAGAKKACVEQGMRLPTTDELNVLYQNYKNGENTVGMGPYDYWSSTEGNVSRAWFQSFASGYRAGDSGKGSQLRVRCVQ